MMKKVTFKVSTGYVGAVRSETFTLEELGIDEKDYETESELSKAIEESYEEWVWGNISMSWDFEE